jgi:ATP adenylyltransferase
MSRRPPATGPVEVLWAPWRMTYIKAGLKPGCIFCAALSGDPRERLLLGTTPASLVMLNRYPYQNGHIMVAPRRHTASWPDLPADEHADLAETLRQSLKSLGDALHPDGLNVGMNLGRCAGAGVLDHMHWHIVPRWTGDVNFMTSISETRIIPDHLLATYDRLRSAFAWLRP